MTSTLLPSGHTNGKCFFNPKKCEFLRITNKKNFIPFNYHIDNYKIQEVAHAKYLGVVIDQHLTWNDHIKLIASKATKVNSFLHHNLYQCPPIVRCNIYKSMVRPIIEFSSPIWDPHTSVTVAAEGGAKGARAPPTLHQRGQSPSKIIFE